MKIRSAVPENGCLTFFVDRKKNKKKPSVKHIRYRLIGGCVNYNGNRKQHQYLVVFLLLLQLTLVMIQPGHCTQLYTDNTTHHLNDDHHRFTIKLNTHRRRQHDLTVELRCVVVGGVCMNSQLAHATTVDGFGRQYLKTLLRLHSGLTT